MLSKVKTFLQTDANYHLSAYALLAVMSAIMMFFYSPLCPGGDFYVHFNRLVVLMDALKDGSYPYYMDYYMIDGYGYLIKAFYSDFILLPFALIGIISSATTAWQVMIFTLTFLCGAFTYLAIKKVIKCKYSALLTALLYTFATYRVFDIYIRGALGEVISFTLLPLVLLGAYEIVKGNYKKWYILTIAFSLLIFSHVISSVLTFITLIIFLLIYYKSFVNEPKRLYYLILSGLVCLPLTACYLLPMIELMLSNSFYYQTHPIALGVTGYRLNEVVAGLFNSVSLRNELLFPKLGALLTFVILLRVFIREKSKILRFVDICILIGLVFLFMTTPLFPWKIYPFKLLEFIQFPWRLLEYISFLFAIAGGYYLTLLLKTKKQKLIGLIGIIIIHVLIFNSDSIHYRTFVCRDGKPNIEVNTSFLGIIGGEYLPSKLPSNNQVYDIPGIYNDFIHHRGQAVISENGKTEISNFKKEKGHLTFDVNTSSNDKLELPLTYYIGYRATLNGEKIDYQQSDHGLIELPINQSGKVEVIYTGTTLQRISYYISIIAIVIFIGYIFYSNRKKNRQS